MFLTHLSAGLGGDLEGGFEGPPLLSGEDGAGPLGSAGVFTIVPLPLDPHAFLRLDVQLLVIAFLCGRR